MKLIILLLIALLGAGYYFGYFNKDDSVNDIISKSKSIANEKVGELKDKAQDRLEEIQEKATDTAKEKLEAVKDKINH